MKYLRLTFILLITQILFGQNPYFNTIDKSQGLLSNSVYDIFQDKDNYMWFATEKGLCQFNGYNFTYFSNEVMTSKAGSCIKQDTFGRIWYENFDGYLYYVENNQLKKLNQHKSIGYFKFGFIKEKLYVLNEKAIDVYDSKKLILKTKIAINTNEVKSIFFTDDTIYVFAKQLLIIKNDKTVQKIDFPEDFSSTFNSILVEKTSNGLIIGSKFSNYCYFFENNKFIKQTLDVKNTIIQNLSWCNEKNWLCTTTGIIAIDRKSNLKKEFFKDVNISYIYKTKNNNYWISTLTDGLFFIEDFDTPLLRSNESLTSMTFKNDQIFIGTKNDKILTLDNNQFKTVYEGKDNHQMGQLFYNTYSNQLFFTSSKFGVLDKNLKLVMALPMAVKSVYSVDHKYITFAASSASGIFKTNTTTTSIWDNVFDTKVGDEKLRHSNLLINSKGKATIYDSLSKIIYFATNNGLFYIDINGNSTEIKHKNNSLNITKLSCKEGKIYACNGDLKLFQIQNKQLSEIEFPKNIKKDYIEKFILKDNLFFLITNKYIFEYQLASKKLKQILHINSNIEINDVILKNNRYYISTNRGLIIKKQEIYHRTHPAFAIQTIKVNNRVFDSLHLDDLAYDENNILIHYSILSPTPFEEHELLYRINESHWQKADILNPELVLSSLNHGNYTVEFALNSDFKNTKKVHFTIHRPFWLQFSFILAASLVVLAILYWLYRNNIKKIEKRNQMALYKINLEKNANQSKLKAIKAQMNPHFFYNALNTLQSYILSNEKKEAIDYLSKFSNLTRTILEMTEKDWISVADEVKTLQLYLDIEKGRFEDDFLYTIQVASEIDQESLKIPSMLLQPYVENAIKHGLLHKSDEKILKISFDKEKENLKIIIDDNGIGRQKSEALNKIKNKIKNKKHQSFATEALQNRIALLNEYNHKNIVIEIIDKSNLSHQSLGTTVTIKIPFNHD